MEKSYCPGKQVKICNDRDRNVFHGGWEWQDETGLSSFWGNSAGAEMNKKKADKQHSVLQSILSDITATFVWMQAGFQQQFNTMEIHVQ